MGGQFKADRAALPEEVRDEIRRDWTMCEDHFFVVQNVRHR